MGTFIDNYDESNQKMFLFKWWLNLLLSGKILMGSHDVQSSIKSVRVRFWPIFNHIKFSEYRFMLIFNLDMLILKF